MIISFSLQVEPPDDNKNVLPVVADADGAKKPDETETDTKDPPEEATKTPVPPAEPKPVR